MANSAAKNSTNFIGFTQHARSPSRGCNRRKSNNISMKFQYLFYSLFFSLGLFPSSRRCAYENDTRTRSFWRRCMLPRTQHLFLCFWKCDPILAGVQSERLFNMNESGTHTSCMVSNQNLFAFVFGIVIIVCHPLHGFCASAATAAPHTLCRTVHVVIDGLVKHRRRRYRETHNTHQMINENDAPSKWMSAHTLRQRQHPRTNYVHSHTHTRETHK